MLDPKMEAQFQEIFGNDKKPAQPEKCSKVVLEQRGNDKSRARKNVERINSAALANKLNNRESSL